MYKVIFCKYIKTPKGCDIVTEKLKSQYCEGVSTTNPYPSFSKTNKTVERIDAKIITENRN